MTNYEAYKDDFIEDLAEEYGSCVNVWRKRTGQSGKNSYCPSVHISDPILEDEICAECIRYNKLWLNMEQGDSFKLHQISDGTKVKLTNLHSDERLAMVVKQHSDWVWIEWLDVNDSSSTNCLYRKDTFNDWTIEVLN